MLLLVREINRKACAPPILAQITRHGHRVEPRHRVKPQYLCDDDGGGGGGDDDDRLSTRSCAAPPVTDCAIP